MQQYMNSKGIFKHTDIKDDFVTIFIRFKKSRFNSINTINKEIELLRSSCRYSNIKIRCLENFKRIRYNKKSFVSLSFDEIKKLVNYFDQYDLEDLCKMTNYLLFYIILYTGCRRTEASNIKIENIDFDNNCIYLDKTKNGMPRIVFFQEKIVNNLKRYIELIPGQEFLFHNFKTKGKLTADNISAIFRYVKKELNLKNYSPHVLRHTMATFLVDRDCNIVTVKNLLGHKDVKTTMIYIHMSAAKNKKDYNKYFPKL
jgi:integrase